MPIKYILHISTLARARVCMFFSILTITRIFRVLCRNRDKITRPKVSYPARAVKVTTCFLSASTSPHMVKSISHYIRVIRRIKTHTRAYITLLARARALREKQNGRVRTHAAAAGVIITRARGPWKTPRITWPDPAWGKSRQGLNPSRVGVGYSSRTHASHVRSDRLGRSDVPSSVFKCSTRQRFHTRRRGLPRRPLVLFFLLIAFSKNSTRNTTARTPRLTLRRQRSRRVEASAVEKFRQERHFLAFPEENIVDRRLQEWKNKTFRKLYMRTHGWSFSMHTHIRIRVW